MRGVWQSGERGYLENSKQQLMQMAGVNISLSKANLGGIPSWYASTPTMQRAFPLRCSDSLQDPHYRTPAEFVPCCTGSPQRTFRVQFALCDPPSYHRRKAGRKGAFMLPTSSPASPSWCPGHLPACNPVPPRNIYFLFFCLDLQRPHFSWIKYELFSWSHEGRKPLPAGVAAAFYCCGCWCLRPHRQGDQRREEGAPGFSLVTVSSVNCAVWSQYCRRARFVIPCFKQFVTEEFKCFSLNWSYPWFISCSERITG